MELNDILSIAVKGNASDIHLKAGLPPLFRLDGALVTLEGPEARSTAEVPEADRAALVAGGEQLTPGLKGDCLDEGGMPAQTVGRLGPVEGPDLHVSFAAPGCDPVGGVAPVQRLDRLGDRLDTKTRQKVEAKLALRVAKPSAKERAKLLDNLWRSRAV